MSAVAIRLVRVCFFQQVSFSFCTSLLFFFAPSPALHTLICHEIYYTT